MKDPFTHLRAASFVYDGIIRIATVTSAQGVHIIQIIMTNIMFFLAQHRRDAVEDMILFYPLDARS
jgi:hypothetical protein